MLCLYSIAVLPSEGRMTRLEMMTTEVVLHPQPRLSNKSCNPSSCFLLAKLFSEFVSFFEGKAAHA